MNDLISELTFLIPVTATDAEFQTVAAALSLAKQGGERDALNSAARMVEAILDPYHAKQVYRYSFWGVFRAKFMVRKAFLSTQERQQQCADYLRAEREMALRNGSVYPPNYIFVFQAAPPGPVERGLNAKC